MRRGFSTSLGAAAVAVLLTGQAQAQAATTGYECLILPHAVVSVASPVAGIVSDVLVKEGERVTEGEVLATLRSDVETANLEIARTRAAYDGTIQLSVERAALADKKVERASELMGKEVVSESSVEELETEARIAALNVDQAEHEKNLAELEVARFEAIVAQKVIRSPIDGFVVERLLWPGESTNEQAHVMTIAELDTLDVRVFVPTALYGQIDLETVATIRPDSPLGGAYDARVSTIDKVFDAASDTFGVRLEMDNSDGALPAGVACRIDFATPGQ